MADPTPADGGPSDDDLTLAWRAMTGQMPATEEAGAAEDAREVAAQRMRGAVQPDAGRQEGASTRYGIEIPGRITAAAGVDALKRFIVEPLVTGARLTKEAWEGRSLPDPEADPEGYRRYVADLNTAASLGVAGRLGPRASAGEQAGKSAVTESQRGASAARTIEELLAPPKPEPPTGSGFLPASKTAAEHVEELQRHTNDEAEQDAYWEDRVARTHPSHALIRRMPKPNAS
jgi:hypothetical protein